MTKPKPIGPSTPNGRLAATLEALAPIPTVGQPDPFRDQHTGKARRALVSFTERQWDALQEAIERVRESREA